MKHASTTEALYLNLSLNDAETVNDEEDIQTLELTLLPPNYANHPENTCIKDLYDAMNTCANMHPDPDASDEDGEDMQDDSAPGASGWITADNMDEYGPGAGTVRTRDEEESGVNGVEGHEEKYHRTG
jgi:nucleotide-sensitive chloride channel 1A